MIVAIALVVTAAPAVAQGPPRAEELRQRIVERFVRNFVQQAGLDAAQQDQFREAMESAFRRRQEFERHRRQLLQALEQQMRPGVAADQDSVTALLEGLVVLGERMAAGGREDQERFAAFLTPVQRALLVIQLERFQRQIEAIQQRRGRPGNNFGNGPTPRRPGGNPPPG